MTGRYRDPRYSTARWHRTSDAVLGKTRHNRTTTARCVWDGCVRLAAAADHIIPVSPAMTDHDFYGRHNLRPLCHQHNVGRALMDGGGEEPPPPRTIFSRRKS